MEQLQSQIYKNSREITYLKGLLTKAMSSIARLEDTLNTIYNIDNSKEK